MTDQQTNGLTYRDAGVDIRTQALVEAFTGNGNGDANVAIQSREVAALAPGSVLAMTFTLPLELVDLEVRPGFERALQGARASGTPFVSFFMPAEMLALAREAGFKTVQHVSGATLSQRYFANRTDGLRPPNNAEELLIATAG